VKRKGPSREGMGWEGRSGGKGRGKRGNYGKNIKINKRCLRSKKAHNNGKKTKKKGRGKVVGKGCRLEKMVRWVRNHRGKVGNKTEGVVEKRRGERKKKRRKGSDGCRSKPGREKERVGGGEQKKNPGKKILKTF